MQRKDDTKDSRLVIQRLDMTPKRVPTAADLQGLTRDEWEALGHDLCATMYNAERVEDRLGRGNGLDALRQLEPEANIDGWQFRRFDDRFGDHQIKNLQDAGTRAVAACKNNLGGQLKTFTVFGNVDLQPGHLKAKGEDARFIEFQKWCKAQYDVIQNRDCGTLSCSLNLPTIRITIMIDYSFPLSF